MTHGVTNCEAWYFAPPAAIQRTSEANYLVQFNGCCGASKSEQAEVLGKVSQEAQIVSRSLRSHNCFDCMPRVRHLQHKVNKAFEYSTLPRDQVDLVTLTKNNVHEAQ